MNNSEPKKELAFETDGRAYVEYSHRKIGISSFLGILLEGHGTIVNLLTMMLTSFIIFIFFFDANVFFYAGEIISYRLQVLANLLFTVSIVYSTRKDIWEFRYENYVGRIVFWVYMSLPFVFRAYHNMLLLGVMILLFRLISGFPNNVLATISRVFRLGKKTRKTKTGKTKTGK